MTVLEFMDSLKADVVLQDKLRSLPNVVVFTSCRRHPSKATARK